MPFPETSALGLGVSVQKELAGVVESHLLE